jgi:uncharacterized protein (DUF983 family)
MATDNGDQNAIKWPLYVIVSQVPMLKTSQLLAFEPLLQTPLWIHVLCWDDQHVKEECR